MNTCTWPEKSNIINITLKFFQKFSDENPKDITVISDQVTINEFFEKLLKVNPTWWGMMKKLWPDIEYIAIDLLYQEKNTKRISIFNSRLQSADTSFYTDPTDLESSRLFVDYVKGLFSVTL